MISHIPAFDAARVLVIGDVMLDRYWYGVAARISPEAPVPVVAMHHGKIHHSLGGAANVAANLCALGVQATLLGLTGDDEASQQLAQMLEERSIGHVLKKLDHYPTITKLRVLSHHQQLMRLDFEESYGNTEFQRLLPDYEQALSLVDVVILSDYGKGTLNAPEILIQKAREKNVRIVVDPKRKDFEAYRGATLITPNQKEFEVVVGACANIDEMIEKGMALIKTLDITGLLITRGEHGMLLLQRDKPAFKLDAQTREVFDVTGAGDTVVATLAAAMAVNVSLEEAVILANIAAGIVVGKLGAATVSPQELEKVLPVTKGQHPIYQEKEVLALCQAARQRGEKIVMTNGCFDILHAGHVVYLNQAKKLGDRLIVAVNTDDSVQKLKGPKRPIHPLEARLQVLSSLSSVDWVLPFSEDTPERLIHLIKPDVLVKGGDYAFDTVVGAQFVKDNGGDVALIPFEFNFSTTRILEKLAEE